MFENHLIRLCPNCKLQYVPDSNQHKEPNKYCPRCGYKLVKDDDEKEDE